MGRENIKYLLILIVFFSSFLYLSNGDEVGIIPDPEWNNYEIKDNDPPKIANLKATTFIPASNPNIVYSGRFNFSNANFPTYSWSGCTINATFTGTSIAAALNDASNYYTIYIDGNFALTLIPNGNNVYQLAQNLPSGNHQVSIFKRTEALFGSYAFGGFYIDNGASLITPPPAPKRRIEVIGDSITCGYGARGPNNCSTLQDGEDEGWTYAEQTARYFGAEVHVICWSGSGFFLDYAPVVTQNIFLQTNGNGGAYNLSSWIPDAVIVNIGTNDHSEGRNVTEWMQIYNDFITNEVRANYGKTPQLFLGCGPMTNAYEPYVLQVVQSNINNGVHFVNLTTPSNECCLGCGSHPTLVGHTIMASSAIAALQSVLGW